MRQRRARRQRCYASKSPPTFTRPVPVCHFSDSIEAGRLYSLSVMRHRDLRKCKSSRNACKTTLIYVLSRLLSGWVLRCSYSNSCSRCYEARDGLGAITNQLELESRMKKLMLVTA